MFRFFFFSRHGHSIHTASSYTRHRPTITGHRTQPQRSHTTRPSNSGHIAPCPLCSNALAVACSLLSHGLPRPSYPTIYRYSYYSTGPTTGITDSNTVSDFARGVELTITLKIGKKSHHIHALMCNKQTTEERSLPPPRRGQAKFPAHFYI